MEVDTEQESSLWILCSLDPMEKDRDGYLFDSAEMVWGEDLRSQLTVNRPRPTVPTNLQKKTVVRDILRQSMWLGALIDNYPCYWELSAKV